MLVRLRRNDNLEEWAIVELQGDLKFDSTETTNKYVGDLHFTKSGTSILIIGFHVLYGKEVNLSKPLAVLEKKEGTVEAPGIPEVSKTDNEYIIKAIVRKKLVFRTRPKPIIMNIPKNNSI